MTNENDLIRRGDVREVLYIYTEGAADSLGACEEAVNSIPAISGVPVYQVASIDNTNWRDYPKEDYDKYAVIKGILTRTLYTTPQDQVARIKELEQEVAYLQCGIAEVLEARIKKLEAELDKAEACIDKERLHCVMLEMSLQIAVYALVFYSDINLSMHDKGQLAQKALSKVSLQSKRQKTS